MLISWVDGIKRNSRVLVCVCILIFITTSLSCLNVEAAAKPYFKEFDYIAYSYVNGINDAPINTAEHYEFKCLFL